MKKPAAGTRIKTHPQRPVFKKVAVAAGRRIKKPAVVGHSRNGCAGISAPLVMQPQNVGQAEDGVWIQHPRAELCFCHGRIVLESWNA